MSKDKVQYDEVLVDPKRIPDEVRILTNVAYMMGDVTDTLMMDAEWRVHKLGLNFKHDCKRRWKMAVEATHNAQRAWKQFAKEMYTVEDVEAACDDSDWFADIILLIADRVGDSDKRQDMVRNMLLRLKSETNIYEKLKGK